MIKDRVRRSRERADRKRIDEEFRKEADMSEKKIIGEHEEDKQTALALADKVVDGAVLSASDVSKLADKYSIRHHFLNALEKAGHGPESYAEQFTILRDIANGKMTDVHVTKDGVQIEVPAKTDTRRRASSGYLKHMNDVHGLDKGVDRDREKPTTINIAFPEAFSPDGDTTLEIGIRASRRTKTGPKSDAPCEVSEPGVWDQEREDSPAEVHSSVLGGDAGEEA
jgi:hypothetical protein